MSMKVSIKLGMYNLYIVFHSVRNKVVAMLVSSASS